MKFDSTLIAIMMFFVILISIQYSLNKIIVILKEINEKMGHKNNYR